MQGRNLVAERRSARLIQLQIASASSNRPSSAEHTQQQRRNVRLATNGKFTKRRQIGRQKKNEKQNKKKPFAKMSQEPAASQQIGTWFYYRALTKENFSSFAPVSSENTPQPPKKTKNIAVRHFVIPQSYCAARKGLPP